MKSWVYCESCGRFISEYKLTKESRVVCKYGCKPKQRKLDERQAIVNLIEFAVSMLVIIILCSINDQTLDNLFR